MVSSHRRTPRRIGLPTPGPARPLALTSPSPIRPSPRKLVYASSRGSHHRRDPHRLHDESQTRPPPLLGPRYALPLPLALRPDRQATRRVAGPYPPESGSAPRTLRRDVDAAAPFLAGGSTPGSGPGADHDLARSSGTPCQPSSATAPSAPGRTARRTGGEYTDHSAAPRPRTDHRRNNQVKNVSIGPSRARRAFNSSGERRTCASRQIVRPKSTLRLRASTRQRSSRSPRVCANTGPRAPRSFAPGPTLPAIAPPAHFVAPPPRPPVVSALKVTATAASARTDRCSGGRFDRPRGGILNRPQH